MSERFSLRDHLFNERTLGQLAGEFAKGVPGFDADVFLREVLPRLPELELMQRLEAIADGIEAQLSPDFDEMAAQLEAAMPPRLDPSKTDDDFGQFIHAVPGILAVRHGLELHRERALDLLHAATQRFSMEYYIRPFLNRWPRETLERLAVWAMDENYHVRRLVSEGTRPRLPWAGAITIDPLVPLPLLDRLYADPTRYVTRSVANHLNDIAKLAPDAVLERLQAWRDTGRQNAKELHWMTRHALRTLVKRGHGPALTLLGYDTTVPIETTIRLAATEVVKGEPLVFEVELAAATNLPVLVDYVIWFNKSDGTQAPKVFKLKEARLTAGAPLTLKKTHRLKWDATTFRLFPGAHRLGVQVNGVVRAEVEFDLLG